MQSTEYNYSARIFLGNIPQRLSKVQHPGIVDYSTPQLKYGIILEKQIKEKKRNLYKFNDDRIRMKDTKLMSPRLC